jgi:Bacterial PH domain
MITTAKLTELHQGEEVKLILKRHWIVYVRTFVFFLILLASTAMLFFAKSLVSLMLSPAIFWAILYLNIAVMLCFIYADWLGNELDFFILTNRRIIGIDQIWFLSRSILECPLDKAQEVKWASRGIFANIFNYGSVVISTASEAAQFELKVVPEPHEQARRILNVIQEHRTHPTQYSQPSWNTTN